MLPVNESNDLAFERGVMVFITDLPGPYEQYKNAFTQYGSNICYFIYSSTNKVDFKDLIDSLGQLRYVHTFETDLRNSRKILGVLDLIYSREEEAKGRHIGFYINLQYASPLIVSMAYLFASRKMQLKNRAITLFYLDQQGKILIPHNRLKDFHGFELQAIQTMITQKRWNSIKDILLKLVPFGYPYNPATRIRFTRLLTELQYEGCVKLSKNGRGRKILVLEGLYRLEETLGVI